MRGNHLRNSIAALWGTYQVTVLSLLLTIYRLPVSFYSWVGMGLDDSWKRAINIAVHNNTMFGKGIVFTYGPLGYLSTRNIQFIPAWQLLLADLFLCVCFYHLVRKYLSLSKGWFWLLLPAVFYFKSVDCSESLFLFFIVFTILNLRNNFNNYFELVCCALCGVVVFFIKVNYGLVALPIFFSIIVFLLINNTRALVLFISVAVVAFMVVYLNVNMDLAGYVRYSLPMIAGYSDGMQVPYDPSGRPFVSAVVLLFVFIAVLVQFLAGQWSIKSRRSLNIFLALMLLLFFYLIYKNGFTRAETEGHMLVFFAAVPLLFIFTMFVSGFARPLTAKMVCLGVLLISFWNIESAEQYRNNGFVKRVSGSVGDKYVKTLFGKQEDIMKAGQFKINDDKLHMIGNATIDILPIDVSILQVNKLNYYPRPVPQSYSAYDPVLDSLNADHFYQSTRPEYVIIKNTAIDNRYAAWDESLTKAMLHLNYTYAGYVSITNDTTLVNTDECYLLLKSKPGVKKYPEFQKIEERTVGFNDTVLLDFPAGAPVYMTADIDYTAPGTIHNIIFQAPILYISLFTDSAFTTSIYRRIIRRTMRQPQLISNVVTDNTDYLEFINGTVSRNPPIRAMAFHANGYGCKDKIKVAFFRFGNY